MAMKEGKDGAESPVVPSQARRSARLRSTPREFWRNECTSVLKFSEDPALKLKGTKLCFDGEDLKQQRNPGRSKESSKSVKEKALNAGKVQDPLESAQLVETEGKLQKSPKVEGLKSKKKQNDETLKDAGVLVFTKDTKPQGAVATRSRSMHSLGLQAAPPAGAQKDLVLNTGDSVVVEVLAPPPLNQDQPIVAKGRKKQRGGLAGDRSTGPDGPGVSNAGSLQLSKRLKTSGDAQPGSSTEASRNPTVSDPTVSDPKSTKRAKGGSSQTKKDQGVQNKHSKLMPSSTVDKGPQGSPKAVGIQTVTVTPEVPPIVPPSGTNVTPMDQIGIDQQVVDEYRVPSTVPIPMRQRRQTAQLATERLKGHAAPVDMFKLLSAKKDPRGNPGKSSRHDGAEVGRPGLCDRSVTEAAAGLMKLAKSQGTKAADVVKDGTKLGNVRGAPVEQGMSKLHSGRGSRRNALVGLSVILEEPCGDRAKSAVHMAGGPVDTERPKGAHERRIGAKESGQSGVEAAGVVSRVSKKRKNLGSEVVGSGKAGFPAKELGPERPSKRQHHEDGGKGKAMDKKVTRCSGQGNDAVNHPPACDGGGSGTGGSRGTEKRKLRVRGKGVDRDGPGGDEEGDVGDTKEVRKAVLASVKTLPRMKNGRPSQAVAGRWSNKERGRGPTGGLSAGGGAQEDEMMGDQGTGPSAGPTAGVNGCSGSGHSGDGPVPLDGGLPVGPDGILSGTGHEGHHVAATYQAEVADPVPHQCLITVPQVITAPLGGSGALSPSGPLDPATGPSSTGLEPKQEGEPDTGEHGAADTGDLGHVPLVSSKAPDPRIGKCLGPSPRDPRLKIARNVTGLHAEQKAPEVHSAGPGSNLGSRPANPSGGSQTNPSCIDSHLPPQGNGSHVLREGLAGACGYDDLRADTLHCSSPSSTDQFSLPMSSRAMSRLGPVVLGSAPVSVGPDVPHVEPVAPMMPPERTSGFMEPSGVVDPTVCPHGSAGGGDQRPQSLDSRNPGRAGITPPELPTRAGVSGGSQQPSSRVRDDNDDDDDDEWTAEQLQALQIASLRVEPSHKFYWQEIARRVPGRTAAECFSKVFDAQKTPQERAKLPRQRALVQKASMGGDGGGRKVLTTVARARRWARDLQVESQVRRAATSGQAGPAPSDSTSSQAASELLEALKHQEQADRYISSFLRRRGGWAKWHKQSNGAQQGAQGGQNAGSGSRPPPGRVLGAGGTSVEGDDLARQIVATLHRERERSQRVEQQEDDEEEVDLYFGGEEDGELEEEEEEDGGFLLTG